MGKFFTQWRILGLLTLALACMLARGWLEALGLRDMGVTDDMGARNQSLDQHEYEMIVIPLTLTSAFLLLTNLRKSNQKKISEPISTEGS